MRPPPLMAPMPNDRIELYRDANRQYRWRLVAGNGQIIDTPGEGFTRRWSARRSARRTHPGVRQVVVRSDW